ncbi:MAG: hypothetical protein Q7T59_02885 [Candidatus Woesebacteria bacterium]|nr:hypothetical protein [Candidatus Woesebacteria bacterium]
MLDRIYIKQPDWVLPMNGRLDIKKFTNEKFENLIKKGFIVELDGNKNETIITGKIIIKGNIKDPLDVS